MENFQDWEKAGKIASEAREFGRKLIKEGVSLLEVTEKVEGKIVSLGGKLAFPTQISLNEIAAHYNAVVDDKIVFGKDIVKIDIGVHINGAIGDTACTVDLTGENKDLVKASEEALKNAIKVAKPGVMLKDIGAKIHETITGYGFSPIRNLCGHGLGLFQIHEKPSIPNFDNGDEMELEEGDTIAIEPFATTGSGIVMEGKNSEIYRFVQRKATRNPNARKIMNFVEEEFKELPFSKRVLAKKFGNVTLPLLLLERDNILDQYKQLVEKTKCLVSQAEHSLVVGKKVITE